MRRLILLIPILVAISVISFGLIHLAPGDPAEVILRALGMQLTQDAIAQMRTELGLNDPVAVQYVRWLWRALHLDLGQSVRTGSPVAELLLTRLPATIQLTLASLLFALIIALPVGIAAAAKQYTPIDHASRVFALIGASMPSFWLGLLLMYAFAVKLGWLPALGRGSTKHLVLPALTLSLGIAPTYSRLLRASLCEVLSEPYVTTARAKGLPERMVIVSHALRNALIPFVTVFGMSFAHLLAGAVVIETIFAWPGIGKLAVEAILTRDFPVVQAFVLITATLFVLANLVVDISYRLLDPRIRLEGGSR
ncbi:MAG: nickel ABC transporter permease [Anaerolineae bacterium]